MLEPIENLVRNLGRLPGLGRRSAGRAALALVREPDRLLEPLVAALRDAQANVCACARCGAFTVRGEDPCALCTDACTDATRDGGVVCVVEEAADVVTIESSGAFRGRYHVLAGKLSPVRHCGPDKLRIAELKDRIAREGFGEVLLALSTDMEGDATAGYLVETLRGFPSAAAPVAVVGVSSGGLSSKLPCFSAMRCVTISASSAALAKLITFMVVSSALSKRTITSSVSSINFFLALFILYPHQPVALVYQISDTGLFIQLFKLCVERIHVSARLSAVYGLFLQYRREHLYLPCRYG